METTNTNEKNKCWNCGQPNDAASHQQAKPTEGDISICGYCGELAIFTNKLLLRELTDNELMEISSDSEVWSEVLKAREIVKSLTP